MPGRAHFADVAIDPSGNFLDNAKISVFERGSTTLADIFSTESTTSALDNPYYITDGIVSHWADAGAYTVRIEDAASPPRVQTREIGWGAVPGVSGGIPGAMIEDLTITNGKIAAGAITSGKLDATTVRNFFVPTGALMPYSGTSAPADFLMCDGTDYDQNTYAALFAVIGSAFNTASGHAAPAAGRFRVPDLRGRAPIGAGAGIGLTARALAATLGAQTHGHTVDAHTHVYRVGLRQYAWLTGGDKAGMQTDAGVFSFNSDGSGGWTGNNYENGAAARNENFNATPGSTAATRTTSRMSASGNASYSSPGTNSPADSSMQPSLALNWIIRT